MEIQRNVPQVPSLGQTGDDPSLQILFPRLRRLETWLPVWLGFGLLIVILTGIGRLAACRNDAGSPADTWTEPWTGITMALVASGKYTMGSPPDEIDRQADETRHQVHLTRPYYVAITEVTQSQWQKVMGANPSHFQPPDFAPCPTCPAEDINYWQIQEFLDRLSARSGHRFRLPTEAEWEIACRAGTDTAFAYGEVLTLKDANFDDVGDNRLEFDRTSAVASYRPNRWGLFDLHGNVWEWTSDPLCPYPADGSERVDPLPECDSPWKVIRGGSWHFGADSARCALRYTHRPRDLGPSLGFRVVRDIGEISSDAPP